MRLNTLNPFTSPEAKERLSALSENSHRIDRLIQAHCIPSNHYCVIATGGYGREELFPFSDIDLLILCDQPTKHFASTIQPLLDTLWEHSHHPLSQSVRCVETFKEDLENDLIFFTSLLSARLIAGSTALFQYALQCVDSAWPKTLFFQRKKQERRERYHRYNDTSHHLEPDLKSSPGGLRDFHMLLWLFKKVHKCSTLHEAQQKEIITVEEAHDLEESYHVLCQMRYMLHQTVQRKEERALFDYQSELAQSLGFRGSTPNDAVYQMMWYFFHHSTRLRLLADILWQQYDEIITQPVLSKKPTEKNKACTSHRKETIKPLDSNTLLHLFEHIIHTNEGLKLDTQLNKALYQYQKTQPHHPPSTLSYHPSFLTLIQHPPILRLLHRFNLLSFYLPAFSHTTGLMQFSLFHSYTVDIHTLFVMENVHNFLIPPKEENTPDYVHIAQTLPDPLILFIAALFHDIGKGRPGDHSELGAKDAYEFCQIYQLSENQTQLIVWLVQHHLLMSQTAQTQDTSNPSVIEKFLSHVDHIEKLNYLYVLTVADIQATNPSLWTSWKAHLLQTLYRKAQQMLTTLDTGEDAIKRQAFALLSEQFEEKDIHALWNTMDDSYFSYYPLEIILWHTNKILNTGSKKPIVSIHHDQEKKISRLFTYNEARKELFHHTVCMLDQLNVEVHHARIDTTQHHHALSTYTISEPNQTFFTDNHRLKHIEQRIKKALHTPQKIRLKRRRMKTKLKAFNVPTQITFLSDTANITQMNLVTRDQPGLLAKISRVFLQEGIELHHARIATFGERVEDTFYISSLDEDTALNKKKQEHLTSAICNTLDTRHP